MIYKGFKGFYDGLEQESQADLQRAKEKHQQRGIEVKTKVMFGQRVKEILSFAECEHVDLLLLQSHPLIQLIQCEAGASLDTSLRS